MKLLINIATRNRPVALKELIFNIANTISGDYEFDILYKIDADDNSYKFVLPSNLVLRPDPVSKIYATNYGVSEREWDMCLNVSDDMRFVKKNWDKTMISRIREVWPTGTDFYAHFSDGYIGHKLATLDIKGREYYDRDNYIYHESYRSVSCDAENLYVAIMRGCHHYFPEVLFRHQHPANTRTAHSDRTYQDNSKWDKADTQNYFKRMAANFHVEGDLKGAMEKLKEYAKPTTG